MNFIFTLEYLKYLVLETIKPQLNKTFKILDYRNVLQTLLKKWEFPPKANTF